MIAAIGDWFYFAHGTIPVHAESIVRDGLNAEAAKQASKGGTYLTPGAFFAHAVAPPPCSLGESLGGQTAFDWGLRDYARTGVLPVILVGWIPGETARALLESEGIRVLPLPDNRPPPQLVFEPSSFETVNEQVEWEIVRVNHE